MSHVGEVFDALWGQRFYVELDENFRKATAGDALSRLCKAYGVKLTADEEDSRRRLRRKMGAGR